MDLQENNIIVNRLTKRFHRLTAINDISFEAKPHEILGLLGPNGAGKSTVMRILCGLIPASSGTAFICGLPVTSNRKILKKYIGYVPENNPLPETMRVEEYLKWRAQLKEVPRQKLKTRLDEIMDRCDLNRQARRKMIGALSKGYRQRVAIADAVLSSPKVIIMDEPTVGLDPHQVLAMRGLIKDLRESMTVIISSHILAEIELYCDRVLIINQGHIVASGTPDALCREFIDYDYYTLEVSGDIKPVRALLESVHPQVVESLVGPLDADNFFSLTFQCPHQIDIGETFLKELTSQPGLRVRSFSREKPTLESIFLAATKRTWKEKQRINIRSFSNQTVSKRGKVEQ